MPELTVPMNRADPFFERDATGWQFIDVHTGRVALKYNLYNNTEPHRGLQPRHRQARGHRLPGPRQARSRRRSTTRRRRWP